MYPFRAELGDLHAGMAPLDIGDLDLEGPKPTVVLASKPWVVDGNRTIPFLAGCGKIGNQCLAFVPEKKIKTLVFEMPDVPSWVRPVTLQASLFGSIGIGLYALRRLTAVELHPSVREGCPDLVANYPALAATTSRMATVADDDEMQRLVKKLSLIAELAANTGNHAAQWHLSRLNAEVVNDAHQICRRAARDGTTFREASEAQEDVVPQLQGHLDDLLHNHLLARSAS